MKNKLLHITIANFVTHDGLKLPEVCQSYQIFGQPLHAAPIVLVNHALTGNSNVADEKTGWWKEIIGFNKVIDTNIFTVIAFNVWGNGFDNDPTIPPSTITTTDIAQLQYLGLQQLNVKKLFAAIGGSIGGGISWEMAVAYPNFIDTLIPIASSWKSSDWIIGNTHVQSQILTHSSNPIQDARIMAMLLYRTPSSFDTKFNGQVSNTGNPKVNEWLDYHGNALNERFELQAYKTMNRLLGSIDIGRNATSITLALSLLKSKVVQVAINSDIFFHAQNTLDAKQVLDDLSIENEYHEIISVHGHDAFLMEHTQLSKILTPHFSI